MNARLAAFVAWAVVAASLAFWALRLLARPLPVPPQALPVSMDQAVRGDVLKLFPAAPAPVALEPQLASRFQLVGVIASPAGSTVGGGVALIAVDGQPARPFRVGARVDGPHVLQSVSSRGAEIGPPGGAAAATLAAPTLPPPNTGTLPPPPALGSGPAGTLPPQGVPVAVPDASGEFSGNEAPPPRPTRPGPDMAR
jgi:general secretion pathway protein C